MKISDALLVHPKRWVIAEALAVVVMIGILDYISEWGLSLFIFYGIPIFAIAWLGHRTAAIMVAVICGFVWFFANLASQPYASLEAYAWASVNRAIYFIFVAFGGAAIRAQREETRAKIEALTRASELEREIVRVSEHEQMRFGQDLHDGLCQNLAAIDCAAACLKADLDSHSSPEAALAGSIQKMLKDAVVEARNLARGIFPVQVDAGGLSVALDELVASTNQVRQASATFAARGEIHVGKPQLAMHLYRIAQEALNNAVRHAGADHVSINLSQDGSQLALTIADDGCGFVPGAPAKEGMGLRTMRYRAGLIGADLEISSEPRGGTVIRCALDLDAPASAEDNGVS